VHDTRAHFGQVFFCISLFIHRCWNVDSPQESTLNRYKAVCGGSLCLRGLFLYLFISFFICECRSVGYPPTYLPGPSRTALRGLRCRCMSKEALNTRKKRLILYPSTYLLGPSRDTRTAVRELIWQITSKEALYTRKETFTRPPQIPAGPIERQKDHSSWADVTDYVKRRPIYSKHDLHNLPHKPPGPIERHKNAVCGLAWRITSKEV